MVGVAAAEISLAVQKVRIRIACGERVPVIHTVGFFAEEQKGGPGERFLRHLSALTGGTFQVSCCAVLRYGQLCYAVLCCHVLSPASWKHVLSFTHMCWCIWVAMPKCAMLHYAASEYQVCKHAVSHFTVAVFFPVI